MTSSLLNLYPSYCFDDILIRPRHSEIQSRSDITLDIEVAKAPRTLKLKIPLISSPMDTVTEENMAIQMALNGGMGIIHRFMPIEEQVKQVTNVKRYITYIFTDPYKMNENSTISELDDHVEDTHVYTVCVMDNHNNFKGLVTKRDIEFFKETSRNEKINYIMTHITNIVVLYKDGNTFKEMMRNNKSDEFRKCMEECKQKMIEHTIEKIPILEIKKVKNSNKKLYTKNLLGVVTWKSVQFYFNNHKTAALDEKGCLRVGGSIGIKPGYLDDATKLVEAGADIINIDVANGHNKYTIDACKNVRQKFPNIVIFVGNVCTFEGFKNLAINTDVDCVRVGIGNGSICSTRLETGIGYGLFSSIFECFKFKMSPEYKNTIGDVKILCDGGTMGKTGNKVKGLAAGCSLFFMGKTLASCEESPGQIVIRNNKRVKYFRGMASTMANLSKQERQNKKRKLNTAFTAEGVDGEVELKGSVTETIQQICGGIRSGLSYLGCKNINELHELNEQDKIEFALSTTTGLSESKTRVKKF